MILKLCMAATAVFMLLSASAADAQAAKKAKCAPYVFIGVRGSGDSKDTMGSQVGPEWAALKTQLKASGLNPDDPALIDEEALHYPAVPVAHTYEAFGHKFTGPDVQSAVYSRSVADGFAELLDEAKRCRKSKLILAGHSQGAHVIAYALKVLRPEQILAVTLFGNPVFRGDSYAGLGDYDVSRNGLASTVLAPRAGLPVLGNPYPSRLRGRFFDYCNGGDAVCQGFAHCGINGCTFNGATTHSQYCEAAPKCKGGKGLTSQAAGIVARLIRDEQARKGKPAPEPTPRSKGPLDVVFAIDTTGSMESVIDSVAADVTRMAGQIAAIEKDYRLALVAYRDAPPFCSDEYQATTVRDFTADTTVFTQAVESLVATGGCDTDESVFTGAMQGLGLAFRPTATKVEILIGDAPGHDPDPGTGFTARDVVNRAQAQSVSIYGLDTEDASGTFSQLTGPTGGAVFAADSADLVPAAIASAIRTQSTAPGATISTAPSGKRATRARTLRAASGTITGPVGKPIALSAATSWSPTGRALRYEWDVDANGTADISTDRPTVSYTWKAAYTGDVVLTVIDSAGQRSVTRVAVTINGAAPRVPARPTKVKISSLSKRKIKLTWTTGRGGGPAVAFVVRSRRGLVLGYVIAKKGRRQTITLPRDSKTTKARVKVVALNSSGGSPASAWSH